jgi:hypothetical protein
MSGQRLTGEDYEKLGGGLYFYCCIFSGLGVWFLEVGCTVAGGTRLLGVLDSRARIPYDILELGNQTSCS